MVQRRIRQQFEVTDIQFDDGTPGPLKIGVTLDVHNQGLTIREYVRHTLASTLKKPVARFQLAVVEKTPDPME